MHGLLPLNRDIPEEGPSFIVVVGLVLIVVVDEFIHFRRLFELSLVLEDLLFYFRVDPHTLGCMKETIRLLLHAPFTLPRNRDAEHAVCLSHLTVNFPE